MKLYPLLALALATCATDGTQPPACGVAPSRPGYVVAFENERAVLTVSDWQAVANYVTDSNAWAACVESSP